MSSAGFAVVRRGRCPETGEDVAVKIVDRQRYGKQHTQNLDREIAILQQVGRSMILTTSDEMLPCNRRRVLPNSHV